MNGIEYIVQILKQEGVEWLVLGVVKSFGIPFSEPVPHT